MINRVKKGQDDERVKQLSAEEQTIEVDERTGNWRRRARSDWRPSDRSSTDSRSPQHRPKAFSKISATTVTVRAFIVSRSSFGPCCLAE
jgi:hypothetical protein